MRADKQTGASFLGAKCGVRARPVRECGKLRGIGVLYGMIGKNAEGSVVVGEEMGKRENGQTRRGICTRLNCDTIKGQARTRAKGAPAREGTLLADDISVERPLVGTLLVWQEPDPMSVQCGYIITRWFISRTTPFHAVPQNVLFRFNFVLSVSG